jgi:hypothetical protein
MVMIFTGTPHGADFLCVCALSGKARLLPFLLPFPLSLLFGQVRPGSVR